MRDFRSQGCIEAFDETGKVIFTRPWRAIFNPGLGAAGALAKKGDFEFHLNDCPAAGVPLSKKIGIVRFGHVFPPYVKDLPALRVVGREKAKIPGLSHTPSCWVIEAAPPKEARPFFYAPTKLRLWVGMNDGLLYRVEGFDPGRQIRLRMHHRAYEINVGAGEEMIRAVERKEAARKAFVGKAAPYFALPSLSGRLRSLRGFRGKVVLMDFFSFG